ncbi:MAG: hypothetical protein KA307_04075 [Burkholderiaceae bacterium]|nr:hypothetical protein [Burkholderiaceae bacterium]
MVPTRTNNLGTWNAAVERGATREERAALLATVPDNWRQLVREHVACYFKVKAAKGRASDKPM